MVGSEKQVGWAPRIKQQIVGMVEDDLVREALARNPDASDSVLSKLRAAVRQAAGEQDQAKWWIDARPNGRAPVRETTVAINILRRRVVEIVRDK
jgi:hypothetical protein